MDQKMVFVKISHHLNIQMITQEECEGIINNFANCIQQCFQQNGWH